jgi:hypothetical protein
MKPSHPGPVKGRGGPAATVDDLADLRFLRSPTTTPAAPAWSRVRRTRGQPMLQAVPLSVKWVGCEKVPV